MSDPVVSPLLTNMEGWQLSIGGAMNPAIHHPGWYKLVGIITDEQMKAAMAGRPTSGPLSSSFAFEELQITCHPTGWAIASAKVDDLERPVKIAAELFDKHLPHTPINNYGFIFSFHAAVRLAGGVGVGLARLMKNANLGLDPPLGSFTRFMHTSPQLTVLVEPSQRDPGRIYVYYQTNYVISSDMDGTGKPAFKAFFIGPKLKGQVAIDSDAVKSRLQHIISGIESMQE